MQRGWSDEELKASVEAYRKLLEGQSANVKIVKAHVYRELAVRFDRDACSGQLIPDTTLSFFSA